MATKPHILAIVVAAVVVVYCDMVTMVTPYILIIFTATAVVAYVSRLPL
jgi:hypothetical protein